MGYKLIYVQIKILTYLLTYSLTPWSKVLLEKLNGLQLVKKFPAFYGTQRFKKQKHYFIIPYMYLATGKNLGHKKMQYNYSKKKFTRRVKPIRIIGDPDNQLPDKRSYCTSLSKFHKFQPISLTIFFIFGRKFGRSL